MKINSTYGPYLPNFDIPDGNQSWRKVVWPITVNTELSIESVDVIVEDINQ